jgi:hypothetical protein
LILSPPTGEPHGNHNSTDTNSVRARFIGEEFINDWWLSAIRFVSSDCFADGTTFIRLENKILREIKMAK